MTKFAVWYLNSLKAEQCNLNLYKLHRINWHMTPTEPQHPNDRSWWVPYQSVPARFEDVEEEVVLLYDLATLYQCVSQRPRRLFSHPLLRVHIPCSCHVLEVLIRRLKRCRCQQVQNSSLVMKGDVRLDNLQLKPFLLLLPWKTMKIRKSSLV